MSKKNSLVYVVVRLVTSDTDPSVIVRYKPCILDTWATYESAMYSCYRYEQEMKERGVEGLVFEVQSSNYYHE